MNAGRRAERSPLLARLLGPAASETTCEECFDRLDRYVEVELGGTDPAGPFPELRTHLEGCPACREDYESLSALLATAPAGDA